MTYLTKFKMMCLAVVAMVVANNAHALDISTVTDKIDGITTSTDAVGSSFVSVVVGIVIFGFIIGMLWRKGR